ncbi:MAG: DUF1905 domain-containing protein [Terracoccus sp.]
MARRWCSVPVVHTAPGGTPRCFRKDGGYVLPLKAAVRRADGIELGDTVTIRIEVPELD